MTIPGNISTQQKLIQQAKSRGLGSAYLFIGPSGIGKEALAVELSKIANGHIAEDVTANSKGNVFESVLKSGALRYIHPLPRPKSTKNSDNPIDDLADKQIEEVKSHYSEKNKNPYHKITPEGAGLIRINQIRFAKAELHKTTSVAHRFVVIPDAENMNTQASNAFLKTLEEPPEKTTLILTTSEPKRILQTINSRCQKVIFSVPSLEEMRDFAHSSPVFGEFTPEALDEMIPFSEGSVCRLYAYLTGDSDDSLDRAINFLRFTLRPDNYQIALHDFIVKEIKTLDRVRFRAFILNVVKVLSMSKRSSLGRDVEYLPPKYRETIGAIGKRFGENINDSVTGFADLSLEMDEVNVVKDVISLNLALRIRSVLL